MKKIVAAVIFSLVSLGTVSAGEKKIHKENQGFMSLLNRVNKRAEEVDPDSKETGYNPSKVYSNVGSQPKEKQKTTKKENQGFMSLLNRVNKRAEEIDPDSKETGYNPSKVYGD